jgi:hypothetical protein
MMGESVDFQVTLSLKVMSYSVYVLRTEGILLERKELPVSAGELLLG